MIDRLRGAASRFLGLLPALLVAVLCARIIELVLGLPPAGGRAGIVGLALALDGLALLRGMPLLFVLSLPALLSESARIRTVAIGVVWSVLLTGQVVLMQYFLTTRVALGADLFGYSPGEVAQTLGAGAQVGLGAVLHLMLPLAALWGTLLLLGRRPWQPPTGAAALMLVAGLVALIGAPAQAHVADQTRADAIVVDKVAYFVEDTAAWLVRRRATTDGAAPVTTRAPAQRTGSASGAGAELEPVDPQYPFLHREQTPDVLGPLFRESGTPPNLVFVIVEGLGRSFSGPGAAHGSFTPFLDELAGRSLYFENFLANQGRTFAALPTIFGSLPFGEEGFAATADVKPLPPHVTLLSVLSAQGYHVRFYAGFDLAFDKERPFLERQKPDAIVDIHDFGPAYPRSPGANNWGYADAELVARTLADETRDPPRPSVIVVQTVSQHTPYTFPGQAAYGARLERRLDELKVPAEDRDEYRKFSNIYTSILYTDDALRTLVDGLASTPAWPDTIFVVTGDHCLPELPMATRIERYHVPLIIYSPLLKSPSRIKAVSSQMDLAPSLLAYLAHRGSLRSPAEVTWLGTGLDLDPKFRNLHEIPLKLAKTLLADFVQGPWYLSRGQLFRLGDGMTEEPASDDEAAAGVQQALARFVAANDQFAASGRLMPESALPAWAAYREESRLRPSDAVEAGSETPALVAVSDVRVPAEARAGALAIEADFTNPGANPAQPFVPLVVVMSADGHEVSETYGTPVTLAPGASTTVALSVKSERLPAGRYFLAIIPSDPVSGKAIGAGRYRVPVRLR